MADAVVSIIISFKSFSDVARDARDTRAARPREINIYNIKLLSLLQQTNDDKLTEKEISGDSAVS